MQVDYCFAQFEPEDPLIPKLSAVDNVYHNSMFVWRDKMRLHNVYAVTSTDGVLHDPRL